MNSGDTNYGDSNFNSFRKQRGQVLYSIKLRKCACRDDHDATIDLIEYKT